MEVVRKVLTRPVRDRAGFGHNPGEEVTELRRERRSSNFDPTIIVLVQFSNGVCGRLKLDEFREEVPWADWAGIARARRGCAWRVQASRLWVGVLASYRHALRNLARARGGARSRPDRR
jgi:hypothetical protein